MSMRRLLTQVRYWHPGLHIVRKCSLQIDFLQELHLSTVFLSMDLGHKPQRARLRGLSSAASSVEGGGTGTGCGI